jgi:hypothetical protein
MDPFLPEIASVSAEVQLSTLFKFVEMAPAAAVVLLIAVLLVAYGLVRFDLGSHIPSPR